MDVSDPEVQDELAAMANTTKAIMFGANRVGSLQSKSTDSRPSKPNRMTFTTENSASAIISGTSSSAQQPNRQSSPPPPLQLSNTDRVTKMELEAILKRPANTPEEKWSVLDARDKLIRLTTARTVDIKKAVSAKGVCPDMCPEKERLSRETKHRVESFESEDGSKTNMNYRIALKEYSRSSADQEMSLPHELRPEPVLKLSMTYLLQNIVDLCDDSETSMGEWYHFLWDRTRSIRKDITQQELCSPGTVLLVEQCARFHIHCAVRLVAEEPSVFDHKINTENLTKCLQSLKYMYHDLGLKMIRFPNEAEFRAYIILLNLQDSNFLWEVKQLSDEIQHSPEIEFAIKVYLAIESNNYVKFFSLVRSTTYMNSCILLRYFTQVRVKALNVMFKAYVPRDPVQMPISNLTYLLAFEDFEQCAQFFEYYGLTCDRDEDRVIFDRRAFFYPDMPFLMDRAINIVEHKRHSTVGDVVHGTPLERTSVLEKYEPHNSFDDNGVLLPKAWTAEDQDYFRPEARVEARQNRLHVQSAKEDDGLFKMPTAMPARSSPKSRLSPKTVPENNSTTSASLFGSNKSAATKNSVLKTNNKTTAETKTFDGFNQKANSSSDSTSKTTNSFSFVQSVADSTDSGFKTSNNSPFSRPIENAPNSSHSIFSSNFSQKPEQTSNIFSEGVSQSTNIFGQAANNSTSIFGGFSNNNATQPTNSSIFGSQHANTTSSVFGGTNANFSKLSGNESLPKPSFSMMPRADEDAKQREEQKRRKELEELERQRKAKAEAEEKERQRKLEEERRKEEKRREEERKRLEQRKLELNRKAVEMNELILEEYLGSEVKKIANAAIEHHRVIEGIVQKIYEELANEVVLIESKKIAVDVKTTWDKNVLAKYFVSWHQLTRKRIEQRQKLENTPHWMPKKPMKEVIPELHHPLQTQTLSFMKRYRSGLPCKLVVPPIKEDNIDLWNIVGPELIKLNDGSRKNQSLYWKCVLSLPDNEEDSSSTAIDQWLGNIFVRQLSRYPRRNDIFFLEQNSVNGQRVSICLRTLSGVRMLNESQRSHATKDIDGTNAIVFFMTTKNLRMTRARLKAVLKSIQLNDAAGIIIYSLGASDPEDVRRALRLDELLDSEKVDECMFANNGLSAMYRSAKHCLKYVAANSFYDDQLEMQTTVSFLRTCLTDELWQRIYLSISRNPTLLEASTRFSFLVDYHNQAIEHLISICSPNCIDSPTLFSNELREFVPQHHLDIPLGLEYFPANWHEKMETHQQQINDFFKSMIVRPSIEVDRISDIPSLERVILNFVELHIPSKSHAQRTAYKLIQHILAFMKPIPSDPSAFKNKVSIYSWLDAFPIFTVDLLSFQHDRFVRENRLPDYVIYDECEFQDYTKTAWWLKLHEDMLKDLTIDVVHNISVAADEMEQSRKRQRLEETTSAETEKINLDEILAKGYASLATTDNTLEKMTKNQSACKAISQDFDVNLYYQERAMRSTRNMIKDLNRSDVI